MERKLLFITFLAILLTNLLSMPVKVEKVQASGTIYIRADGSIEGTTDISTVNNITYLFTDNIYDSVVVERDNIFLDGQGYLLQVAGSDGNGITLSGRSNVTLSNVEISVCDEGIYLSSSSNNTISGNNIMSNDNGILLSNSSYNTISRNNIASNNYAGIKLLSSSNNTISGNNITENNFDGVFLLSSSNYNTVSGNNIMGNDDGVLLSSSSNYNTVSDNNIASNDDDGIYIYNSSYNTISRNNITNSYESVKAHAYPNVSLNNNTIYHNNFVNNNLTYTSNSINLWDDGCEGNYWSDYNGTDSDGDGIGDTPYIIDVDNQDNFPLMNHYWNPADINHDLEVDMFDVDQLCDAYYSTPLDSHWNCHCDLIEPYGFINIFDVVKVCVSYGEKY